jgi:hypothetical protein
MIQRDIGNNLMLKNRRHAFSRFGFILAGPRAAVLRLEFVILHTRVLTPSRSDVD